MREAPLINIIENDIYKAEFNSISKNILINKISSCLDPIYIQI